jgi:cohesin complex subunit SA-1/2
MSSAANRPFRHTATFVSLAVIDALAKIAKGFVDVEALSLRQSEGEKRKRQRNQKRISDIQANAADAEQKRQVVDEAIRGWFDVVFIHRYRDIDPRIRSDCAQGLGEWIMVYPEYFFEGSFLRYLGWVLSDENGSVRHEVIKQLQKLYQDKEKMGGLRTFTERFRPRIVEIATSDPEAGNRAAAIELLDVLRETGFLEPDDIDSIGRLIFDAEPRVRKAVVRFFAENLKDMYETKYEEIGGEEAVNESTFLEQSKEGFDRPRLEWLKFKALAEVMTAYDAVDEIETDDHSLRETLKSGYLSVGPGVESRISFAAQDLYGHVDEIEMWEVLAGYLLFDHSANVNGTTDEVEARIREECILDETEELALLQILNTSAKLAITEAVDNARNKKNLTKAQQAEAQKALLTTTRHLADLIPKLLKKFGSVPETAASVLRLEPLLDLEVLGGARHESSTFSSHIDDINRQLLTHGNETVATEAIAALLHAREATELGDITETKLQAIWEQTVNSLHELNKGRQLSVRGGLSPADLSALSNLVLRIEKFAQIYDCVDYLDRVPKASKRARSQPEQIDAFAILLDILNRGLPSEDDADAQTAQTEDLIVNHACNTLLFYFLWRVKKWTQLLEAGKSLLPKQLEILTEKRDALVRTLQRLMRARHGADALRLHLACTMLDVLIAITTLRNARVKTASEASSSEAHLNFIIPVPEKSQEVMQQILLAAEKVHAKRSHKKLEVAEDDDPIDPDDEPQSEDEEIDADDPRAPEIKLINQIMAERQLCEYAGKLVFAIIAGIIDEDAEGKGPMKKLLERNKSKLGKNFMEIVSSLEDKKKKMPNKSKPKVTAEIPTSQTKSAKTLLLDDEEQENDEDMDVDEDEDEDEEQNDAGVEGD